MNLLFDENLPPLYKQQIHRHLADDFEGQILRFGDENAPQSGTQDPDILIWCEDNDFVVVSEDRATMPHHFLNHLANGRTSPGVVLMSGSGSFGEILFALALIVGAMKREELRDRILFIPLP